MSEDNIAKSILGAVDTKVTPKVNENAKVIQNYLDKLQPQFASYPKLLAGAYLHVGSAYETFGITEKTDFDIQILLPEPYTASNFVVERDDSGYFALKWKGHNSYLDAVGLQQLLFKALRECIAKVNSIPGIKCVTYKEGLAALTLQITTTNGKTLSVDLAPQITARSWGVCPDLVSLSSLPACLRRYISNATNNGSTIFSFSPAVLGNPVNKQRLCNISFALLEKEFLKSNTKVRDMARLMKLVVEACDWKKKYYLKSFHIKRLAIKYSDALEHKTLWEGYKTLLQYLCTELNNYGLDGFFVKDQITYKRKLEKVQELRGEVVKVLGWSAAQVQSKIRVI